MSIKSRCCYVVSRERKSGGRCYVLRKLSKPKRGLGFRCDATGDARSLDPHNHIFQTNQMRNPFIGAALSCKALLHVGKATTS
jgi:hypothetical protein